MEPSGGKRSGPWHAVSQKNRQCPATSKHGDHRSTGSLSAPRSPWSAREPLSDGVQPPVYDAGLHGT